MVTTLAALYNTRSARTATAYSDSSAIDAQNKASISAKAEADRIRAELVQTNSLISSTQGKIDSIPTDQTLSDNSQVLQGRLNAYLKDKRKYEDRLTVLQSIQDRPIDGSKVRRSDFYAFISGVLHINDPDKVEFFTGAIPSVFLEVITPIMLAVALFL
jgi:hypothetical protein